MLNHLSNCTWWTCRLNQTRWASHLTNYLNSKFRHWLPIRLLAQDGSNNHLSNNLKCRCSTGKWPNRRLNKSSNYNINTCSNSSRCNIRQAWARANTTSTRPRWILLNRSCLAAVVKLSMGHLPTHKCNLKATNHTTTWTCNSRNWQLPQLR